MKTSFILLTIGLLTSCSTHPSNDGQSDVQKTFDFGTPYDTVDLKGDEQLIYYTTTDKRNLRLTGSKIDTLIWSNEIDELEKFMGWLEADFANYFVLYSSGGNGVYNMRLVDKKNGRTVDEGVGIKNDTTNNKVYFQDNDDQNNNLTMIDLLTLRKETFEPPAQIECIQWWNCIDKIELTDNELTLTYFNTPEIKEVRKYARQSSR